jgi:excisionase family DNA binding protein
MAAPDVATPWLTIDQCAHVVQCGRKLLYRAVKRGDLRAARIGARRDIRVHRDWLDEYLTRLSEPRELRRVG